MYNIGDVIFQFFSIIVVIFLVTIMVYTFRTFKLRISQLDRIEEKLDKLVQETPKE